ncbi:hypothetical protein [Streptomyces calidiresistens]|uniref:Uncharacterized protein n=1 Tax=Streptomyces calidiresistens TaxID=1485586 RepID=A0A7W3T0L9_9ACTN|nr:hypothetical protein [Streptomyces calidiresistens]MBB0228717.1 hypothetical protein [Streptomyces calidiresistens]
MLRAGERPVVRWRDLRRARVEVVNGRLRVDTRWRGRSWPLGSDGVASATISSRPCATAARARDVTSGCVHLCDASERVLACLLPTDWAPNGEGPVPVDLAGTRGIGFAHPRSAECPDLTGLRDFLDHHRVPWRRVEEQPVVPPRSAVVRPGPRAPVSNRLRSVSCAIPVLSLPAVLILMAITRPRRGVFGPEREAALWICIGAFLLVTGLVVGGAMWSAVVGWRPLTVSRRARRAGGGAVLRPVPGTPVSRAFLRRARVVWDGEELWQQTAGLVRRRVRGPGDPVLGVRRALLVKGEGRHRGVAFVDDRETVLLFLPWSTWFAGDPSLSGLREFCDVLGIRIAKTERPMPRGGPNGPRDPDARRRRSTDYTGPDPEQAGGIGISAIGRPHALVLSGAPLPIVLMWAFGHATALQVMVVTATALTVVGVIGVRGMLRHLWWGRMIRAEAPESPVVRPRRRAAGKGVG